MKKAFIFAVSLWISFFSYANNNTYFTWGKNLISIEINSDFIIAKNNGRTFFIKDNPDRDNKTSILVYDFNFDKYPDLAILRDSGIEKYYDIFIFSDSSGMYIKDAILSALPCPVPEPKDKTIIASCFHQGGCESWQEKYKYKYNKLNLLERDGVSCDSENGKTFKYKEFYKNGKLMRENH